MNKMRWFNNFMDYSKYVLDLTKSGIIIKVVLKIKFLGVARG